MTAQKQNKRVIVVGACGTARLEAARRLEELHNHDIEIITPDEALERGITITKTPEIPIPEIPKVEWQNYPETRAERRAKARKKKRR